VRRAGIRSRTADARAWLPTLPAANHDQLASQANAACEVAGGFRNDSRRQLHRDTALRR
jgi:hypothetical protein